MRWKTVLLFALPLAVLLILASIDSSVAQTGAVIDFEDIPAGTIVETLSSGNGISGEVIEGFVTVFGRRADLGLEINTAMVFDAACPPDNVPADCSGNDGDLFKPELGKVLIISEDLDSSDPDDADLPGSFWRFDFSNWGTGTVTVDGIHVMDVEEDQFEGDAMILLYSGGAEGELLAIVDIPDTGNNGLAFIPVGVSGVDFMRVTTNGSGAIDNIGITPTPPNAVELIDFWVSAVFGQKVELSWETAVELDNTGFNIYRSRTANVGEAAWVGYLPSESNSGGNLYTFEDLVPAGGAWWYWIADVDTSGGETFHGPLQVEAVVFGEKIYLPMLVSP